MPAAVIFDHDGTLLETESAWWRAEVRLFSSYGREFTMEHKRTLLGSSPQRAGQLLAGILGHPEDDAPRLADALYALAVEEVGAGVEPMPGALELLGRLREAGTPVGLASNSRRVFLEAALAGAGIPAGTFGVVLAAEDVEHPKPAPHLYLRAAEALGAQAFACVALEDSPTGVASARAAGMTVVGVPSVPGVQLDADLVAASLEDPRVHALTGP